MLTWDAYLDKSGVSNTLQQTIPDEIKQDSLEDFLLNNNSLADFSVGEDNVMNGAITTLKIKDASITNAKIKDAAITTAKIQDAAITNAKINSVSADKITTSTLTAQVNVGSGSGYVKLDGQNNRIIINDGNVDRILIGYQLNGF